MSAGHHFLDHRARAQAPDARDQSGHRPNSFVYGDSLTQNPLEGHKPYALQKLGTADVDALRQQMFSSEKLRAYVSGRIVGEGRGVWAVTDQAVLLRNPRLIGVERLALSEVTGFEAERDRFAKSHQWQNAAPTGWALDCIEGARRRLFGAAVNSAHFVMLFYLVL